MLPAAQTLHQINHARPWRRRDGGHDRRRHPHHPWRRFAGLSDWKLRWVDDLGGDWGRTSHSRRTVFILNGLDQAERRCTIAHETEHVIRGPLSLGATERDRLREELAIDRHIAKLLVPDVHRVGHALAWAQARHDVAAEELWVDPETLGVRLSSLTVAERAWLHEQLSTVLI